jgi:hypothetical protein
MYNSTCDAANAVDRARVSESILSVVMAAENPVGLGGQCVVGGSRGPPSAPALTRQPLESLSQPELVERLGAGAEVRHAVDFGRVTDETVDGPSDASRFPRDRRINVGRHAERRNERVVTPQHEPDLFADDRVDITHDSLRDEVGVEQRLRNPGGRLVGLVDEIEQRLPALGLRACVAPIPLDDNIPDAGIESGRQRFTRHGRNRRPCAQRGDEQH